VNHTPKTRGKTTEEGTKKGIKEKKRRNWGYGGGGLHVSKLSWKVGLKTGKKKKKIKKDVIVTIAKIKSLTSVYRLLGAGIGGRGGILVKALGVL